MASKKMAADSTAAELHTHEAVCAERYGKIIDSITGLTKRVGRIEAWAAAAAGSLILGMAGLIVTLVVMLGKH